MIVTCPRRFSADDVTYRRLPDRMVEYVCSGQHDDDRDHSWLGAQSAARWPLEADDGVTDELLDPLRACVHPGEPFAEYGVVEYRFRCARPDLFIAHIRERGHVMLAPSQATASSVRFAVALGRLARVGELLSEYGRATGAWSYNTQITYWARPPKPSRPHLTWAAFCESSGRSAEWTEEDRAALREWR
ncbi:MAG: hypothetical protein AB7I38_19320 [Dehalococcoidia bacterium]